MDRSDALLTQLLGGDTLKAIAKSTGARKDEVSKVLSAAVPVLVAGMHDNARTKAGEESLTKALSDHAGDETEDIAGYLAGVDGNDSQKILDHVLGENADSATRAIAKKSGVSNQSTIKILLALAPLLLSLLGKQNNASSGSTGSLLGSLLGGDSGGTLLGSLLGNGSGGQSSLAGTLIGALLNDNDGGTSHSSSSSNSGGLLGTLLGGSSGGLLGSLLGDNGQQQEEASGSSGGLLGGLLGGSGGGLLGTLFGDDSQEETLTQKPKKKKTSASTTATKKKKTGSASSSNKKSTSTAGKKRSTGKKSANEELASDVLGALGKLLK
jgi:hypothetical protein